jgi:5-methylcytosine-specific restriction endonuclease McrBC regulatory subunit McrC
VCLNLIEYGPPKRDKWDKDLLDALRVESSRWKDILGLNKPPFSIEYIGGERHAIRAQGVTGFLQIGSLAVEVQPKFLTVTAHQSWRQALWRILTAVEEHPRLGGLSRAGVTDEEESFPDILGWVLLKSIQRGRLEGLPRGYVEARGDLDTLRGSLDISRVSELITRPYLLPCVYDVYCEDTPVNRLIRWSASHLSSAVRSPQLARMLSDEATGFGEVGALPPGLIEAEHLTLPVQYQHLDPALHVSRLLLRRQSLQHQQDEHQAPSFLWKSSDVFQKFVGHLLHLAFDNYRGWYVDSPSQVLAEQAGNRILTYPDYRVMNGRRAVTVLDAKYKVWGKGNQPLAQDVYQMMAAGRINDCGDTFLIYPTPYEGRKAPVTWQIRGKGQPVAVTAVFINLLEMGVPSGEETLVANLKKDVTQLISPVATPIVPAKKPGANL